MIPDDLIESAFRSALTNQVPKLVAQASVEWLLRPLAFYVDYLGLDTLLAQVIKQIGLPASQIEEARRRIRPEQTVRDAVSLLSELPGNSPDGERS
jgi:hypothetical protein